jgi:hypothetical protein
MSRAFAEEETYDVCKVCDYAIRNEDCPGCGLFFQSFSIKEHDAAIRRQTIEEVTNEILGRLSKVAIKSYTPNLISMDEVRIVLEQMKGEL